MDFFLSIIIIHSSHHFKIYLLSESLFRVEFLVCLHGFYVYFRYIYKLAVGDKAPSAVKQEKQDAKKPQAKQQQKTPQKQKGQKKTQQQ